MNSYHYIPIEGQSRYPKWVPYSVVAAAVVLGAVAGLGFSAASAETTLYTAPAVRTIPAVQSQAVQWTTPMAAADSVFPEPEEGDVVYQPLMEEQVAASSTASWAGVGLMSVAAAAGFFLGSRKTSQKVALPETVEVVIDDAEEKEIAMAAVLGLLGHKVGMTRIPDKNGSLSPVTVIRLGPCVVTQVKTKATDGYEAIQVGFSEVREDKLTKPERGHLAKTGAPPLRHLREYRVEDASKYTPGQVLMADVFAEGDLVDVQGEKIGKGFQGPIRRWGFARGLTTHGSKSHREPGSTGPGSTPGRVYPGSKGPGRVGGTSSIRKLTVVGIDTEQHLMLVKGSIPGPPGNLVSVQPTKTDVYAVVAIGGHQYIVQPGQILSVDKLPLEDGDVFNFEKVLLVKNFEKFDVGHPYVSGAKVTAEVLRNSKGKKIRIFKYRAKKHTRLTKGHRQKYTDIHITEIDGHTVPSRAKPKPDEAGAQA